MRATETTQPCGARALNDGDTCSRAVQMQSCKLYLCYFGLFERSVVIDVRSLVLEPPDFFLL